MATLNITTLRLPEISPGLTTDRDLRELKKKLPDLLEKIDEDIIKIVNTQGGIKDIFKSLQFFINQVETIPNSDVKEALLQKIRLLALVISSRLKNIPKKSLDNLKMLFEKIKKTYGQVPVLNTTLELPAKDFLPPRFEQSKKSWKDIAYLNPSRTSKEYPIDFFSFRDDTQASVSSIRLYLISLDSSEKNPREALSYADAGFYELGDLQADHLQPSEQIISRQKEMIDAMNMDPLFKAAMLAHPANDGYFIEKDSLIYGTKWFYLAYHNTKGNSWFMNPAANTGSGKGNQDALEWLESHPRFKEGFFNSDNIKGKNTINTSQILYTTYTGKMLAETARGWFRKKFKNEIFAAGCIREDILRPTKERLEKMAQEDESDLAMRHLHKKKQVTEMVRLSLAKILLGHDNESTTPSGDSGSERGSTSIESHNAEMTAVNKEKVDQRAKKRKRDLFDIEDDIIKDYIQTTKLERSRPHAKKP